MAPRTRAAVGEQLTLFESEEPKATEQRGYTYEYVPDGRGRRVRHEPTTDELAGYEADGEVADEFGS